MKRGAFMAAILAGTMALSGCRFSSERKMIDPKKVKYADCYSYEKILHESAEKVNFDVVLEAEDGELSSGAAVKTAKAGYSGSRYVDVSDNAGFKMTVELPASQFYKITVRHCAGSHKENALCFNGVKALDIYSEEAIGRRRRLTAYSLKKA